MDSFSYFPFAATFWIASHEPRFGVNFELLLGALGLVVGQLLGAYARCTACSVMALGAGETL